ncbi:MAG TPA: [LysW]-aminoadipate kinase [Trueperaceae bacterium]|nr:[LysW]-aminoadipate kinase [Trueperaceae bacterium]
MNAAGKEIVVVKLGGAEGIDLDAVCDDVAALRAEGVKLVLVHGGSAETNRVATLLGHPPRFVTSPSGFESRFTDRATLEIFEMVYCGKVNKGLVERLQVRGVDAVGLSGLDGRLLTGRRKSSVRSLENGRVMVIHGDHTGTVERVNTRLLTLLLSDGYLPVITPPALSDEGVAINVDGDRAAAVVASALGASDLLLLSNVPGLLRAFPDESTLIARLDAAELEAGMCYAKGRMKKKLLGAGEALAGGVRRVVLGDARVSQPIRRALAGEGTVMA